MNKSKHIQETIKKEFNCPECKKKAFETITTVRIESEVEKFDNQELFNKTESK